MHRKTTEILNFFSQINAIPRCSGNEAGVAKWLIGWAEKEGFDVQWDSVDNLVIRVPASLGFENAPAVVLQGHMDMVCEKTPGSNHDFSKDPIPLVYEGDWVTADGTSLGADNGIALAIAMAIATSPEVQHPPLELLFTVDEETGLNGAKKIEPGFFSGKIFLNIDSEKEGIFTVGCAGGKNIRITLPLESQPSDERQRPIRITVSGLRGGHSGIDIHRQRASANVLLTRMLQRLRKGLDIRLAAFKGGTVHNAIARDAEAIVLVWDESVDRLVESVAAFEREVRLEYDPTEPMLEISAAVEDPLSAASGVATHHATGNAVRLMTALPHGVAGMSRQMPELVETSCNLATVRLSLSRLEILTSLRSASPSRLVELSDKILSIAELAGATVKIDSEYAPWPQDPDSPLLKRCREVYVQLFGREPEIEVIHAGLECAVIGDIVKGMDMISFGPDMENPHSPDERLNIPSIEKIWAFCKALLESYKPI